MIFLLISLLVFSFSTLTLYLKTNPLQYSASTFICDQSGKLVATLSNDVPCYALIEKEGKTVHLQTEEQGSIAFNHSAKSAKMCSFLPGT